MRNTLIINERRGRLAEADTAAFLRGLSRLGVIVDCLPGEAGVMTLARKHRLTVYDASYLELAQRETLLDPPEPTPSLRRAFRRHRELIKESP